MWLIPLCSFLVVFLSFCQSRGRYPHSTSSDDIDELISVKEDLFDRWKLDQSVLPDCFARYTQNLLTAWSSVLQTIHFL